MTSVLPRPSLPVVVATQFLLVLLLAVGVGTQIVLPEMSAALADTAPEYADLRTPLLALAIAGCVLLELAIVAAVVLVHRIHAGRMLVRSSLLWVDVIVAMLVLAIAIVVTGFVVISNGQAGSPFLALVQVVAIVSLAAFAGVTLVLRSLLRQAIVLRTELDEVV
jgi:hypothetical protein